MAKTKKPLNFRFHNPNPIDVTVDKLVNLFIEVNRGKVENLIKEQDQNGHTEGLDAFLRKASAMPVYPFAIPPEEITPAMKTKIKALAKDGKEDTMYRACRHVLGVSEACKSQGKEV